ncbi:Sec20-domain-containing protein [Aaosphaeria arxii CBS 175.79]|uniref:Sec20-domain-containing protein n=1 Tax=Aaosphaeria arxii CBS 175.79 TaxID=1450172 RepID=A0A6A5XKI4_9PLEO|nr:Sec20-domain-containing protein [Aaosphaeria arxii CBS 175.79]KAF2013386.1 Sec20-domain-containing protein [Aaosphaeria arxii CBS 175.79]
MPPLPSTTQSLTIRLNTLSEWNKETLSLIQRLSKLDFQPGALPQNSDEGDARLELSAEIHESLKQTEEELELLKQEVEDVVQGTGGSARRRDSAKESERSRLAVLLARLTEDLRSTRTQFRRAQLAAKHNADRAKLKERELLFSNLQSGTSTPSSAYRRKQNSQLTESEIVGQASSDVTAALRRTHQLMQNELSRSRFAQETLEQSTAALADLGEKYTDLSTLLSNSRALVTTLLKSQKSDTWYLETTLYILITTVIWLIFRRWLYGPISWFILWPLKIVFRVIFAVVPSAGLASAGSSLSAPSEPSTSLIVKPSATGAIPKRDPNLPPPYVRVGGGGRGYRQDPSPPGSYSQQVGQMAEQNRNQQQEEEVIDHPQLRNQPQASEKDGEPVVRADGTVLQESDKPRNPKKKMWEENVEAEKHAQAQQEQQQDATQGQQQRRKRDEL